MPRSLGVQLCPVPDGCGCSVFRDAKLCKAKATLEKTKLKFTAEAAGKRRGVQRRIWVGLRQVRISWKKHDFKTPRNTEEHGTSEGECVRYNFLVLVSAYAC
jgi:hypothetical protein